MALLLPPGAGPSSAPGHNMASLTHQRSHPSLLPSPFPPSASPSPSRHLASPEPRTERERNDPVEAERSSSSIAGPGRGPGAGLGPGPSLVARASPALPPGYDAVPASTYAPAAVNVARRNAEKQAVRDARAGAGVGAGAGKPPLPKVRISTSALDATATASGLCPGADRAVEDGWLVVDGGDEGAPLGVDIVSGDSTATPALALPEGMEVREALARCEDPRLGWSLQFWITIKAPVTGHVFYACPATGQTSWTAPTGVFVVPRQPEGEWWELADTSRGNRSYFYNTATEAVQWTRPEGDAFVIPLGLIQTTTLPKRPRAGADTDKPHVVRARASPSHLRPNDPSSPLVPHSRPRSSSIPPVETLGNGHGVGPTTKSDAPSTPRARAAPRAPPSPLTPRTALRPAPRPPVDSPASTPREIGSSFRHVPLRQSQSQSQGRDQSQGRSPEDMLPLTPTTPTPTTPSDTHDSRRGLNRLSVVGEEMSGNEADDSVLSDDTEVPSWVDRRPKMVRAKTAEERGGNLFRKRMSSFGLGAKAKGKENSAPKTPLWALSSRNLSAISISAPSPLTELNLDLHALMPLPSPRSPMSISPPSPSLGPIPVPTAATPSFAMHSKRLSSGLHPVLPAAVSADIQSFLRADGASPLAPHAPHFAVRRSGLMRQRVPLERVLQWQKSAIGGPLLEDSKPHPREAVMCFKVVQRTMGERNRAVDGAKPVPTAASVLDLHVMGMGMGSGVTPYADASTGAGVGGMGGAPAVTPIKMDGKSEVLHEIRWLVQTAVAHVALRDEVYAQVVKQLTKNPNGDAMVLGFQLLCVLVNAFGPRKAFESPILDFLNAHTVDRRRGIATMARYCHGKLERASTSGARARLLSLSEIEHASDAAFYPSIYGDLLENIMQRQTDAYCEPLPRVPVVLPFLARAIVKLGGMRAEGIFRIPGDAEAVAELRSRMDRGHYQMGGVTDPHVAASLFKLFLRELEEPVVPSWTYNDALLSTASPGLAVDCVRRMPRDHRRTLAFVIFFARAFCADEVVRRTKMTPGNLALVLAPNILRTTSDSLVTVYTNSSFESKWILTLIEHLHPKHLDEEDRPDLSDVFLPC